MQTYLPEILLAGLQNHADKNHNPYYNGTFAEIVFFSFVRTEYIVFWSKTTKAAKALL